MLEILDDGIDIVRQRTFEFKITAGMRMNESKQPGVQSLPVKLLHPPPQFGIGKSFGSAGAAVNRITDNGPSQLGKMDSDLMGAARLQSQFN
jgi:hypothetical protein